MMQLCWMDQYGFGIYKPKIGNARPTLNVQRQTEAIPEKIWIANEGFNSMSNKIRRM